VIFVNHIILTKPFAKQLRAISSDLWFESYMIEKKLKLVDVTVERHGLANFPVVQTPNGLYYNQSFFRKLT